MIPSVSDPHPRMERKKEEESIKEYVDHVPACPHITFDARRCGPPPRPLFLPNPKRSTAVLVRCQIPLSAGPNPARLARRRGPKRSEWMLHLAAVWPQLSVRRDGIYRDKTAEHRMDEESLLRKSQKYVRMSDLCSLNTPGVVFQTRLAATERTIELYQTLKPASTFVK